MLAVRSSEHERIEELDALRRHIESADVRADETFRVALRDAQVLLELSQEGIAEALLVSRPTVNRWLRGKNLPSNALRKAVFRWVAEQLDERTRVLTRSSRLRAAAG
ncbi:MAG TPA: helix-turn-helix transcriptional regulator [Terriglobales bacterium]|jgi:DNA-binding transcriptional regulator YiaG|nr:helix-turn-helix transcriptional regulator [Terriglobales bacterium]